MSDDGIDSTNLVDSLEFCLVINGPLVGPIDIGSKWLIRLLEVLVLRIHAIGSVDGCGPTHA